MKQLRSSLLNLLLALIGRVVEHIAQYLALQAEPARYFAHKAIKQ